MMTLRPGGARNDGADPARTASAGVPPAETQIIRSAAAGAHAATAILAARLAIGKGAVRAVTAVIRVTSGGYPRDPVEAKAEVGHRRSTTAMSEVAARVEERDAIRAVTMTRARRTVADLGAACAMIRGTRRAVGRG